MILISGHEETASCRRQTLTNIGYCQILFMASVFYIKMSCDSNNAKRPYESLAKWRILGTLLEIL